MHSKLIKPEAGGRKYPCVVIDEQCGDGQNPTVYLKPDKYTSVVLTLGYMGEQMGWKIGQLFDGRSKQVQEDGAAEEDGELHGDLPLFRGQVVVENGGA